jgi:hypothetical protein
MATPPRPAPNRPAQPQQPAKPQPATGGTGPVRRPASAAPAPTAPARPGARPGSGQIPPQPGTEEIGRSGPDTAALQRQPGAASRGTAPAAARGALPAPAKGTGNISRTGAPPPTAPVKATGSTSKPGTARTQRPAARPGNARPAQAAEDDILSDDDQVAVQAPEANVSDRTRSKGSARKQAMDPARKRLLIIAGAAVGVVAAGGLALALAWTPMAIAGAVADLDACKSDAGKEEQAKSHAERWFALVHGDTRQVMDLISADHGPVPAQVFLAQKAKSIKALLAILDRKNLAPPHRLVALKALDELTQPAPEDKDQVEDIASRVAPLVRDRNQVTEINAMAMTIYTRLRPDAAEGVLWEALKTAGDDGEAVTRILDNLSSRMRKAKFAAYLELAYGGLGATVRTHEAFYTKGLLPLAETANTDLLIKLVESDEAPRRVVGFDMLAGPNYQLPPGTDGARLRERIAVSAATSLAGRDRAIREIEAAFKVARKFHLSDCVNPVLQLAYAQKDLTRQGITREVLAEALGKDLTTDTPAASANAVVERLTSALDDSVLSPVAVRALALVKDGSLPAIGLAIERLDSVKTTEAADAAKALKAIYKPAPKPPEAEAKPADKKPEAKKPVEKPVEKKPADKPAAKPDDKKP